MKNPIQLSVPTPCHENWDNMAPVDKGRFCASCQKNVRDFTRSSDREIASAFANETNLCGRFLPSQLDRELYVPKKKDKLWIVASVAVVNVLGLQSHHVNAQEANHRHKIYTVNPIPGRPGHDGVQVIGRIVVDGAVGDAADSLSLAGVTIINRNTMATTKSDDKGKFSITVGKGDPVDIQIIGYEPKKIIFNGNNLATAMLKKEIPKSYIIGGAVSGVYISQRRTFFGRIFHAIGSVFR